jgi:hypothetical protein
MKILDNPSSWEEVGAWHEILDLRTIHHRGNSLANEDLETMKLCCIIVTILPNRLTLRGCNTIVSEDRLKGLYDTGSSHLPEWYTTLYKDYQRRKTKEAQENWDMHFKQYLDERSQKIRVQIESWETMMEIKEEFEKESE